MSTFERIPNLDNKVAVVVGAAGHVGFATCYRLATLGAKVYCISRSNIDELENKVATFPNYEKLKHKVIQADITNSETLKNAVKIIAEENNQCHVLINAAGLTSSIKPDQLDQLTDTIFDEIITTNLRGVFSTIREFAPMLKNAGDSVIINISSTASLRASQSNVAYSAAKAGLNIMTQTLAKSLAPEIRILSIVPGFLTHPTSGGIKSAQFNDFAASSSPLKRIGDTEDIVNTIESCILSIRFATGSIFVVDGGRTL